MTTIILKHFRKLSAVTAAAAALFLLFSAGQVRAGAQKKIAILPFTTNSDIDLSHIREGIRQMLYSRLAWEDKHTIVLQKEIMPYAKEESSLGAKELAEKVGRKTGADHVVFGSVTEFAGAFSIDAKILETASGELIPFHTQAGRMERIIPELDLIAARINKDVFNRETQSYAKIEQMKADSEERLRRMNPEKMIPYQQRQRQKEDKPLWMFWKFWD